MSKTILILVFTLCSINSFAGWFSANHWEEETPHGNHINGNGQIYLNMSNGVYVNHLKEWYFYDDCVIGRMDTTNKCHIYTFFVAHEWFNTVDTFNNEKDWKAFIELHHLEPLIWKRTYTADWRKFPGFGFFLAIIIFCIPIFNIYRILKTTISMNRFEKSLKITSLIIIGLLLLRYLLDIFPGSI